MAESQVEDENEFILDEGFEEILKPIRDLSKNFQVKIQFLINFR